MVHLDSEGKIYEYTETYQTKWLPFYLLCVGYSTTLPHSTGGYGAPVGPYCHLRTNRISIVLTIAALYAASATIVVILRENK